MRCATLLHGTCAKHSCKILLGDTPVRDSPNTKLALQRQMHFLQMCSCSFWDQVHMIFFLANFLLTNPCARTPNSSRAHQHLRAQFQTNTPWYKVEISGKEVLSFEYVWLVERGIFQRRSNLTIELFLNGMWNVSHVHLVKRCKAETDHLTPHSIPFYLCFCQYQVDQPSTAAVRPHPCSIVLASNLCRFSHSLLSSLSLAQPRSTWLKFVVEIALLNELAVVWRCSHNFFACVWTTSLFPEHHTDVASA